MYRLAHYDESRTEVLHALMKAHPFATLVVGNDEGLIANHLPVLLRSTATDGQLVGHIARANPLWQTAPTGTGALLVFQGPSHYVSPRWYQSGKTGGKAVPTWDYAVVHARGAIEWVDDKSWLEELLDEMAETFERGADPWRMAEMPVERRDSMLNHIVGFRIRNLDLQGKFKLNQGSSPEDRAAIVAELESLGTDGARELAVVMTRASPNN